MRHSSSLVWAPTLQNYTASGLSNWALAAYSQDSTANPHRRVQTQQQPAITAPLAAVLVSSSIKSFPWARNLQSTLLLIQLCPLRSRRSHIRISRPSPPSPTVLPRAAQPKRIIPNRDPLEQKHPYAHLGSAEFLPFASQPLHRPMMWKPRRKPMQ